MTGIGSVAKLYYEMLSQLPEFVPVNFYQVFEHKNVNPPVENCVIWNNVYTLPHFLEIFVSRILSIPKHLESVPEELLLLVDPTIAFHFATKKRRVVIVHDLRPFTEFETNFGEKIFYRVIKRSLLSCDFFICDSCFTGMELKKLGVSKEKIAVIYPFINNKEEIAIRSLPNEELTITYIANNLPYKNIRFFIEIANAISSKNNSHKKFKFLLITSDLNYKIKKFISKELNLFVLPKVADINQIYSITDIYVTTSLYEGIGLPVLEAMSHGIPVVAGNIPVNIEVIQDYGILCNSNILDDWIKSILSLTDPKTYAEYSLKSLERTKIFTKDYFIKTIKDTMIRLTQ
ncbi:MAG: glycosyltransferase [Candidatus Thermoplasmatota archaeon]|nr:glycosyltransferase [Candidatus Thermoplasmatota archaeon]